VGFPSFYESGLLTAPELHLLIADRIRIERRKARLSQRQFAEKCGIPLRTFKRFEAGQCDSLEAFLRIVISFERTVALELLFPPKPAALVEARSAGAVLERIKARIQAQKD
jgi:transcriptional regulator with XRE-family HTH domain